VSLAALKARRSPELRLLREVLVERDPSAAVRAAAAAP
jgi:hypothetical protein